MTPFFSESNSLKHYSQAQQESIWPVIEIEFIPGSILNLSLIFLKTSFISQIKSDSFYNINAQTSFITPG
jgi:hypothetical protein